MVTSSQSPGVDAYGVAVDSYDRVWLASTEDTVFAFMPDQRRFCAVRTGPGSRWLSVAGDGSIWVTSGVGAANAVGRLDVERATRSCS
jgi:streptogramin lyase